MAHAPSGLIFNSLLQLVHLINELSSFLQLVQNQFGRTRTWQSWGWWQVLVQIVISLSLDRLLVLWNHLKLINIRIDLNLLVRQKLFSVRDRVRGWRARFYLSCYRTLPALCDSEERFHLQSLFHGFSRVVFVKASNGRSYLRCVCRDCWWSICVVLPLVIEPSDLRILPEFLIGIWCLVQSLPLGGWLN